MDLMYSRYTNPTEFMNRYINQGRFGELVIDIINAEYKRRIEALEQKEDEKLWMAYLLGGHEESFLEWKQGLLQSAGIKKDSSNKEVTTTDASLTEDDIQMILQKTFSRTSKNS